MEQLILHLLGDYVFQSDWMAQNKTKQHWAAFVHALVYSLPFLILMPSPLAWLIILVTHFFIDRYRLAIYWVKFINQVAPADAGPFGYPKTKPDYISFWLMVIIDNTLHLSINYLSLLYL